MIQISNGDKFNNWTVINETQIKKGNKKYVLCQCNCENKTERFVYVWDLEKGNSKSCGCLNRAITKQKNENRIGNNKYDLNTYDYGVCYIDNNNYFIFDLEDYDKIKNYSWKANYSRGGYIQANGRQKTKDKGGSVYVSRIIMGLKKGDKRKVDHINHNIYDNRKSNLRICESCENSWNSQKSIANTSGHKGVHRSKSRNRYEAYVGKNNKRYRKIFNINKYNSEEEAYNNACKWVEEKTLELHKEFTCF